MASLTLQLLGSFQATLGAKPLTHFRTNKVQVLLIYLSVENNEEPGKVHQREALMTLLWPGLPLKSAQVNLRQTFYQLRRAIPNINVAGGGEGIPFLIAQRYTVQINQEYDLELDITSFSKLLAGKLESQQLLGFSDFGEIAV